MKLTVCWTARGRNKRFYHDNAESLEYQTI